MPAMRHAWPMRIKRESNEDREAVSDLIARAFLNAEHSDGTEASIVDALRAAGALTISLVATEGASIVGHVAFSPVTIDGAHGGWFGLGPVAVHPAWQGRGVGRELIEAGLAKLQDRGALGCVVLGDPAYYARFGFRADPALRLPNVPPMYFQQLTFGGDQPTGTAQYHKAFG